MADTDTSESQEDTETAVTGEDITGQSETVQATEKHLADLRKEAASYRTKLRKSEAAFADYKASTASEIDKAKAEARTEALSEATAEANKRILRAEVISVASGKLHDPTDAVAQLDLAKYEVDDKGDVDRKAIAADIDELLKAKPYLGGVRDPEFGNRPTATSGGKSMNDLIKQRMQRR